YWRHAQKVVSCRYFSEVFRELYAGPVCRRRGRPQAPVPSQEGPVVAILIPFFFFFFFSFLCVRCFFNFFFLKKAFSFFHLLARNTRKNRVDILLQCFPPYTYSIFFYFLFFS